MMIKIELTPLLDCNILPFFKGFSFILQLVTRHYAFQILDHRVFGHCTSMWNNGLTRLTGFRPLDVVTGNNVSYPSLSIVSLPLIVSTET